MLGRLPRSPTAVAPDACGAGPRVAAAAVGSASPDGLAAGAAGPPGPAGFDSPADRPVRAAGAGRAA
ncbi:hypothetical protein ACFU3J_24875 [Streptomyces sp. NPDC057411]|uniref:hypothetical protein n=1 Tax=unclassified Streptomyces TaxID=2593676 RepID=UPI003643AEDD